LKKRIREKGTTKGTGRSKGRTETDCVRSVWGGYGKNGEEIGYEPSFLKRITNRKKLTKTPKLHGGGGGKEREGGVGQERRGKGKIQRGDIYNKRKRK